MKHPLPLCTGRHRLSGRILFRTRYSLVRPICLGLLLLLPATRCWGQCFQSIPGSGTSINQAVSAVQLLAVGDFNGDGKPDLVTISENQSAASILFGDGQGGLGPAIRINSGGRPIAVAVGDFNSDNKPDIAIAQGTDPPDGSDVLVLLNGGNGGFGAGTYFKTGISPSSILVSDVNSDGKSDLVTANSRRDDVSVLIGDGKGGFGAVTNFSTSAMYSYLSSIKAGDFNGDGKPDLVITIPTQSALSLLLNNGRGGFDTSTISELYPGPYSVETGDFNADGKPDLAVAGEIDGILTVLLNTGDGYFTKRNLYYLSHSPYYVTTGDFNGDGKADLAVPGDKSVTVLLGMGDGSFGEPVKFSITNSTTVLAITTADFNGDGKPDLAVSSDNRASILINCSPPYNAPPQSTTNASQTATVGIPVSITANAFTDAETPNSLTYSASLNPANGLSFDPAARIISGTPSVSGVTTVIVTATDPGGSSASTRFTITVNNPPILGTDEPGVTGLTVSPNPATDLIQVSLTDDYRGPVTMALIDAAGKTGHTHTSAKSSPAWQHTFSLRGLPAGIYYLTVQQNDRQTVKKVLLR